METDMTFDPTEYDWQQMFELIDTIKHVTGGDSSRFTIKGIAVTLASSEGENDRSSWLWCGKLGDGRYAFVSGRCCYTGWDCQGRASAWVADNLWELCRFGMGEDERDRLGMLSPSGT